MFNKRLQVLCTRLLNETTNTLREVFDVDERLLGERSMAMSLFVCLSARIFQKPQSKLYRTFDVQGGPKKRGHRLMTIILSNLNRFKNFLLQDSLVNSQLNGY